VTWSGDKGRAYQVTLSQRDGVGGGDGAMVVDGEEEGGGRRYMYATSVPNAKPSFDTPKLVPPCATIRIVSSEDVPLE